MRFLRRHLAFLVLLVLSAASVRCDDAFRRDRRYFPETGRAAVVQRALDLSRPLVVLSIALEPGQEDLAALAALRLGQGAAIVSCYVSTGATTPSDAPGELPTHVAARRKNEATHAMIALGGNASFLNFPDLGVPSDGYAIDTLWQRDTVVERLAAVFRTYAPDIVIVAHDWRRDEGDTLRSSLVDRAIPEAVAKAGNPAWKTGTEPWLVSRIFFEDPSAKSTHGFQTGSTHPLWKESFQTIAARTERLYASLQSRTGLLPHRFDRRYADYGIPLPKGGDLTAGLPVLTPQLHALLPAILKASKDGREKPAPEALRSAVAALRAVELQITRAPGGHLPAREKRILVAWKYALEDLRCSLLGVTIEMVPSDSIITDRQLFWLRSGIVRPSLKSGETQIYFPLNADSTWYINEKDRWVYPFTVPAEFKIVTPEQYPMNFPVSQFGLNSPTLFNSFPYIIVHKDRDPLKSFSYRGEVLLRTGPMRSFEVLTPVVRVTSHTPAVFSLWNITRDRFHARMTAEGEFLEVTGPEVTMAAKDVHVVDTLHLSWNDSLGDGDHLVQVIAGKRKAGKLLARKFSLSIDSASVIGLLTGIRHGALEQGIQRAGHTAALLTEPDLVADNLRRFSVIVVDRSAFMMDTWIGAHAAVLRQWIERGGRFVVFPQRAGWNGNELHSRIRFEAGPSLPPDAPVASTVLFGKTARNAVFPSDWDDWVVARSRDRIEWSGEPEATYTPLVTADRQQYVLAAQESVGHGAIVAVALDLSDQLDLVHPGAMKMLANLLDTHYVSISK